MLSTAERNDKIEELKQFVIALENVQLGDGIVVRLAHDKINREIVGVKIIHTSGMITVETAWVSWYLGDPEITKQIICERLARELGACWEQRALKVFLGNEYREDGSPVMLVEELSGDKVVRI